jgi:formate dehydrogenase
LALLGSVPGELGLRKCLETQGHTLVVTSDKDGANSVLDRELPHTEIVISQPFWRRLKPFDMHLHYLDRHRLQEAVEKELNLTWHPNVEDMVKVCKMKRGAYSVNTARGKICDRDAIVRALESGQLASYAGDVRFPQPAPKDHPWRTMQHHGMTPHISGTSLSAQACYAAGAREILECYFEGRPIRDEYLIVAQS